VFVTLAEAAETKNKPPARTATGAKANRKFRNVICKLLGNDVLENRFIRDFHFGHSASGSLHPSASFGAFESKFFRPEKISTPSTL
jgi:hypothetical protein